MREVAAPALEERVAPGIAAEQLAALAAIRYAPMRPSVLADWLVSSGFAELVDDRLVPTRYGAAIGGRRSAGADRAESPNLGKGYPLDSTWFVEPLLWRRLALEDG